MTFVPQFIDLNISDSNGQSHTAVLHLFYVRYDESQISDFSQSGLLFELLY